MVACGIAAAASLCIALSGAAAGSSSAPPNDNFADATVLPTGDTVSQEGDSNVGATLETGEPTSVATKTGGASVWYSWTPVQSTRVRVDTATSDFDTLLAVYTGSAVGSLTEVASNDDATFEDATSQLAFDSSAGTTYLIRVDGLMGASGTINLHILPTPANDDFDNATALSGQPLTVSDSSVGATVQAGEDPAVAGTSGGASVWYSWTATVTGRATIDTAGSGFNTLLGVFTGTSVDGLTDVASNDDDPSKTDGTSLVSFDATAGTTYVVKVDGSGGVAGAITMHLSVQPPPANDDLANATVLGGRNVSHEGDTNVAATLEPDEAPNVAGQPGGASIWYSWTAPAAGHVQIDTATSDFDTLLGVYTGSAVGSLTEVASNDDADPAHGLKTSFVAFDVTSGTTYRLRVDGFGGATGTVAVHVGLTTAPDAPTGVTAAAGAGSATVSWTAPASDGGSGVTGYHVIPYVADVAQPFVSVGAVLQASINGLANGTAYTFRVTAVNVIGESAQSTASTAVTPKANQVISVTTHAPSSAAVNSSFSVAATAPGGPVAFSSSGQCTNVGTQFTMAATAGTCFVLYDQVGDAGYNAAPHVQEAVTVTQLAKADQTITVNTAAPANAGFGSSFTVAATAPGGAVNFSSAGSCTNAGVQFTMTSATGTCSVKFDQAGSVAFNAAPQVVEQVAAQKASQSIDVTSHAPATATAGTSFTVAASAPGGAVTYSSSGACSNSGGAFTMTSATGPCSVMYDQGGGANYNAAAQVVESVTATAAPPTRFALTVTKNGSGTVTAGGIDCGTACTADIASGTSVTLTASAAAGSRFSGWSGACTGSGTCTLTMDGPKNVTATFIPVVAPPKKKVYCVVPNLRGKSLVNAERKLASAHCKTGKVMRVKSKTVPKFGVISQSPGAGKKLRSGSKVNLVVSRGRR